MQLVPIVVISTANVFDLGADYDKYIKISPLTTTVLRNDMGEDSGVQVYFGSTEL